MIKLLHGDCLEEMDKLIKESVRIDAIITDPPQGKTVCKWDIIIPFDEMWIRLKALRKERTPIVLFGNEPYSSMLRMSNLKEYKYDWVWNKIQSNGAGICNKRPMKNYENIIVFYKHNYYPQMVKRDKIINTINWKQNSKKNITGGRASKNPIKKKYTHKYPISIITINSTSKECNYFKRLHPTQKPVVLMEYLIKTYTQEGDTVIDFCMGSGSTGEACINLNRSFIGIEKDKDTFNTAKIRIKKEINKSKRGLL